MTTRIAYQSTSCFMLPHRSDLDILYEARAFNKAHHITGFLLRTRSHFYQILEGPEAHVRPLMARIRRDDRHHGVVMLGEGVDHRRLFSEWSMGYATADRDALPSVLSESKSLNFAIVEQALREVADAQARSAYF